MASDTIAGLGTELDAALAALVPKIRGLEDLTKVSLSPQPAASVQTALAAHNRRRDYIQVVKAKLADLIDARANLVDDGYPQPILATVSPSIFQEFLEQQADLAAAFGEFQQEPKAVSGSLVLPNPTDKPV